MRRDLLLTVLAAIGHPPRRPVVSTPEACATCLYRTPQWNDGGYCYFWKGEPPEKCGTYEAVSPPTTSPEVTK